MEWDKEAVAAVERAPFFVRRMIRKKAEEYVKAAGENRVTLVAVQNCRQSFLGAGPAAGRETAEPAAVPPPAPANGDVARLTDEQLWSIERLTEEMASVDTRYYAVKGCGGAAGCPLALADVSPLVEALARRIAASGVPEHIQRSIRGPVLSHYKFRAAVAGCPNNCSEPQIKDFAVVAQARPGPGPGECIDCNKCVETCREGAVRLEDGPHFDYDRCLNCGRCASVCPTEAIATMQTGYAVLVGGKLGRHAQLATRLLELADEDTVFRALDACLELYKEEAHGVERLGAVLNRTGLDVLRDRIASATSRA